MPHKDAPFSSQSLRERLLAYPTPRTYLVGFSGGVDSTALLAALYDGRTHLQATIEAIHFNHGLQAQSDSWERHCREFCSARDIPLTCHALDLFGETANLEGRARELRYRYLEDRIDEETLYLTAHNADDRAETFLLHALRGSGLDGLASIPEFRTLGNGHVARPLLEFSREALRAYVVQSGIDWIEDPSNQDARLDRNFIRLEVLPLLETRWPAAREALAGSARQARRACTVLDALLLRHARLDRYDDFSLPLDALFSLGNDSAGLVLRAWLRRQGAPSLPEARMDEFLGQLAAARRDAQCETTWADWALRRFRGTLHLIPPGDCPPCPDRDWGETSALDLGPELGRVRIDGAQEKASGHWAVGPRRPGGTIRLRPAGPSRKIKKVLQEQDVPPWQRESIPVLYRDDEVMAVGDWLLAPEFTAWLRERGCQYRWQPLHPELRRTRRRCIDLQAVQAPA